MFLSLLEGQKNIFFRLKTLPNSSESFMSLNHSTILMVQPNTTTLQPP